MHTEHPSRAAAVSPARCCHPAWGQPGLLWAGSAAQSCCEVPSWTLGHSKATQAGQEPDSHRGPVTPCPAEGAAGKKRFCSQEDEGDSGSCRGPAWQDWGGLHQPRGALRAAPVPSTRPKTSREAPGAAGLNLGCVPEEQEEALLRVKAKISSTSQPEEVTQHPTRQGSQCARVSFSPGDLPGGILRFIQG